MGLEWIPDLRLGLDRGFWDGLVSHGLMSHPHATMHMAPEGDLKPPG